MPAADPVDVILRLQGLRAFLAGTREASAGIREMGAAAGTANAESAAGAASTSRLAGAMGLIRKASRWGALGLVATGVASIKMAANFDQAMTMVHTQAGASTEEVARLRGQVLKLAEDAPQGPQQLAEGLYHLESIGLRGAKAMDALKVASQGAAVGQADIEDTASALGAAWLTNIKGAGSLRHVMGLLNATVGAGNIRMGDLVRSLGTGVLPSAKVAGLGIKDVMGALAILSDEGYQGSSAMAQLATAFHFLYAPTEKARKSMEQIGLTQFQLAQDMRTKGLPAALQDLRDHLDSFSKDKNKQADILSGIVPGGRGRVLLTLMNQLDRYRGKIHQIEGTSGHFNEAVKKQNETTANKLRVAWSSVQVTMVKLGHQLAPVAVTIVQGLAKVAEKASKLITAFSHLPHTQKVIIGVAAALTLLAVAGGPVALVIGVIAGGAFLIIKNWKGISHFFSKLWSDVSGWAVGAWHLIMRETEPMRTLVAAVFQRMLGIVKPVVRQMAAAWGVIKVAAGVAWHGIVAIVRSVVGPIVQIFKGLWTAIKGVVNIIAGILTGDFGRAWRGVKQVFGGGVKFIIGIFKLLTAPIRTVVSHIGGILDGLWKILKKVASFVGGIFKSAFQTVLAPLKVFGGAVHTVIGIVGGVVGAAKKAAGGVGDFVKSTLGFKTAKQRAEEFRASLESISDSAHEAATALHAALDRPGVINPSVGELTGRGNAWGGIITPGRNMTWVGERGPELVQLPSASRVHPHHSDLVKTASIASAEPTDIRLPDIVVPVNINGREVAKAVGQFTSDKKARK